MKNAIVFGGSGFLGSQIVNSLAESGYRTVLTYRSHKPMIEESLLPRVTMLSCDICNADDVASAFKTAQSAIGTPYVVINAAGIALPQSLLADVPVTQIDSLIQTNLLGALYISKSAASVMHERHNGVIIHISSLWGTIGASCEVAYSAAKGGVNSMVKALAKELAPDGIRVNAVAPGLILSPMNAHLTENDLSLFKAETPLNCYIASKDVMRAIYYLIESEHVTGQVLAVDGGIVI